MIGVLTLFGETDLQKTLQKEFVKNDLIFVSENAKTSVQLLSIIEKNAKETDVVIISAGAITLSSIFEIIDEIWKAKNSIRVIVILNGGREQYLKSQLTEFRARGIDIIFDDRGFDIQRLIQFAKKGPLKKKIEDEKVIENTVADILSDAENEKPAEKSITENETLETDLNIDSFSEFRGHYCVGIMNTTHGAGATMLAQKIATCFALQNVHTAIVDYSGTEALSLIKIKGVDYITEPQTLRQLRKKYNAVIIDFGTPYIISPKGNNFTRDIDFQTVNTQEFAKCNIKILMGLSAPWHIKKFLFFLDNYQWKSMIDSSFLCLLDDNSKKIMRRYPSVNILKRTEDISEQIYEIIRREELK